MQEQKEMDEEVAEEAEEQTNENQEQTQEETPEEQKEKTPTEKVEESTQIDESVTPESAETPAWNGEIESEKSFKALQEENLALTKKINDLELASNAKIESLEKWMSEMADVLKKTLDYVVGLKNLISEIPVAKGYTHEKVETKKSAYGEIVQGLKTLRS